MMQIRKRLNMFLNIYQGYFSKHTRDQIYMVTPFTVIITQQ